MQVLPRVYYMLLMPDLVNANSSSFIQTLPCLRALIPLMYGLNFGPTEHDWHATGFCHNW